MAIEFLIVMRHKLPARRKLLIKVLIMDEHMGT